MLERNQTFDLLKGLAVIFMIQVHILELFATPEIFQSSLGKILLFIGGPPCAPVFLFVFGYFVSKSQKTFLQLIKRGAAILAMGILLNMALNFNLFYSVFRGAIQVSIFEYIFGIDILIHAGISICIIALIKHLQIKNPAWLIAFMLVTAFMGLFLLKFTPESNVQKFLFAPFFGAAWWSYFPIFPWLSYSLAGYTFFIISNKMDLNFLNTPKSKVIVLGLFLIFIFFTIKFAVFIASNLQQYYHHGLIFFLWTVVFIAFYAFIVNILEKWFGNTYFFVYIKWLGKNVTIIYIIQWIIIGNSATEIYRSVDSGLILIGSFIAVMLAASTLCYVFLKFKVKRG